MQNNSEARLRQAILAFSHNNWVFFFKVIYYANTDDANTNDAPEMGFVTARETQGAGGGLWYLTGTLCSKHYQNQQKITAICTGRAVTIFLLRTSVFAFWCLKNVRSKSSVPWRNLPTCIFTNVREKTCSVEVRTLMTHPEAPGLGPHLTPDPGKSSVANPSLLNGKGKNRTC